MILAFLKKVIIAYLAKRAARELENLDKKLHKAQQKVDKYSKIDLTSELLKED
jgi:molecular chaperone GrpE (heat shock protein)